jgi:hypothetical protein
VNFNNDFVLENISSYDWFKEYFYQEVFPEVEGGDEICSDTRMSWDYDELFDLTLNTGDKLVERMGMELCDPTPEVSQFFKRVYTNPKRVANALATEKSTGWDR